MKLPSAKKLPSGNWNVSVMIAGERISITAPTKKEAENQAAAIKSGAKAARKKTGLTVGEAIDQYVESKDAVLSPATIAGYKRIRANALQDIMDIDLDRLTPQIVQRSINMMARNKSPKTVRNAHGLLSATLAVYRPDIALRTTLPQKVRYEISIPSDDDIGAIMKACKDTENELPIMLALWLGLRMSEILGLKWEDVDGDVLHIRLAKVDEGVKTTKTYISKRDLDLPQYLQNLIAAAPHNGEYIVNLSRRALYCRFQTICKKAGVQHYRFHDLRHINASVMLALGIPNKYAEERMGHATDNMLKTVYQHTISSEQRATARKVNGYFESKLQINLRTD